MAVNLIDKIMPKNDAFIGLVDYGQIIGLSGLFESASGVLQLELDAASGYLQGQIDAGGVTEAILDSASGTLRTDLELQDYNASGVLDTLIDNVQTEMVNASGAVIIISDGLIYTASGVLDTLIDNVQAEWVAGSGALGSEIYTASGSAVTSAVVAADSLLYSASGVLDTLIDSVQTEMVNASGSVISQLYDASGTILAAAALAGDTILYSTSGTLNTRITSVQTELVDASGLFLKKDGSTSLTAKWNTDFDITTSGILTASGLIYAPYETVISGNTEDGTNELIPSGFYYEIRNDDSGHDGVIDIQAGNLPIGSIILLAYVYNGGGRKCTINTPCLDVDLSSGRSALALMQTSIGWMPIATYKGVWDTSWGQVQQLMLQSGIIAYDGAYTEEGMNNPYAIVDNSEAWNDNLGASGSLVSQLYSTSGFIYTNYMNQLLTTAGTPQFARLGVGGAADASGILLVKGMEYNNPIQIIEDNHGPVRQMALSSVGGWRRDNTADDASIEFNRQGYLDGQTKFRDFVVFDGKGNEVLHIDGSAKGIIISAPLYADPHVSGQIYVSAGTLMMSLG